MKKVIVTFLVLLMLCGCSNVQAISPEPDIDCTDEMVSSFLISDDETSEEATSIAEDIKENDTAETANEVVKIDERTEESSVETATPIDTIYSTETTLSEPSVPAIQQEKQEEGLPDTTSQSDEKPSESQPVVLEDVPPETEPTAPKSIYDYEFDAAAIRQELISIGIGMGLEVDNSLTSSNASWANPITASKGFQGESFERSLKAYVRSIPSLISAYGGEPIQYFSIYVESLDGGSYCFYFLY